MSNIHCSFSPLPPCIAIQFWPPGSLPAPARASGQCMCTCAHALAPHQVHSTARRAARPPPAVPVWGVAHVQEWDKAPSPATPHIGIITTWQPSYGSAEARSSQAMARLRSGMGQGWAAKKPNPRPWQVKIRITPGQRRQERGEYCPSSVFYLCPPPSILLRPQSPPSSSSSSRSFFA